jgi:hypothetical protein
MKTYATSVDERITLGTDHLFLGHSVQPGTTIFKGFFGPCGPGKSVEILAEAQVLTPSGKTLQPAKTETIAFDCDNKTHQGEVVVTVSVEKDEKTVSGTITFKVEITTNC